MAHLNYTKLGWRWRRTRGFRLNCARLSVRRLRARILAILGIFDRCFKSLRKDSARSKREKGDPCGGSRMGLMSDGRRVSQAAECKIRSCVRSNSFYAEAIADCLEFIKRNSVSVDDGNGSVGGER